MAFIPRLSENSPVAMLNNPDWYSNNYFYNIPTTPAHDYGLPNCTCYALGRWIELFRDYGISEYPDLSHNNANTWFGHNDRYERGQTPKLGAIACWETIDPAPGDPPGSPGHVAVVEEEFLGGGYRTSQSNYGAEYFITYYVNANNYFGDPNLRFQGFIYLPVEPTPGTKEKWYWFCAKKLRRPDDDMGRYRRYTRRI